MAKSRVFFGGVPTAPEVRLLREKYGVPPEGIVIPQEEVESLIGCPRTSHRYRTITNAWRKGLYRETLGACFIGLQEGSFLTLPPQGRVDRAWRKTKSGFKGFRNAVSLLTTTERSRLTEEGRREADHAQLVCSRALEAARVLAKQERIHLPRAGAK